MSLTTGRPNDPRPVVDEWNAALLATLFVSHRLSHAQTTYVMQRTPSANRSTIILTSGIISALLSAALFCLAYLVL